MGVFLVRAVREIQARDVHAEAQQVAHSSFGVAGWADGADDFGTAEIWGRALLRFVEVRLQLIPSTAGWNYGIVGVGAQGVIVREGESRRAVFLGVIFNGLPCKKPLRSFAPLDSRGRLSLHGCP
jgi:hypothetical protein